jgi:hypothetical protein
MLERLVLQQFVTVKISMHVLHMYKIVFDPRIVTFFVIYPSFSAVATAIISEGFRHPMQPDYTAACKLVISWSLLPFDVIMKYIGSSRRSVSYKHTHTNKNVHSTKFLLYFPLPDSASILAIEDDIVDGAPPDASQMLSAQGVWATNKLGTTMAWATTIKLESSTDDDITEQSPPAEHRTRIGLPSTSSSRSRRPQMQYIEATFPSIGILAT